MILNRNGFTKSNRERNCQDKPGPQAGKAIARDTAQGYTDSSFVYDCPRMKSRKNPAPGRKKARRFLIAGPQTVDNPSPLRRCTDSHGEIVKRGRESPLHVQSMQKWELFRKFPFLRLKLSTLCRQLEARRFQIAGPCLYGAVFHSTVTDLARFLGLSMSQPFSFAA